MNRGIQNPPHKMTPLLLEIPRRCLIVDDDVARRAQLREQFEADGFACDDASSSAEALAKLALTAAPLVFRTCHGDVSSDLAFVHEVSTRWPDTAIVVLVEAADQTVAIRCLELGAMEYITKPCPMTEVRTRVRQALERRRLLVENRTYRHELETRVSLQARKYEELFLASLQSLADALEVKDAYTWGHSTRVSMYAVAIARELSLPAHTIDQLELGSRLHDLGKIGVREAILNKDGALTTDEYAHVMEHTTIGWRLLAPLLRDMPNALAIVRSHHERFDGRGTPDALRGHEIPLEARITSVADSFDAMTSGRVYRSGMSVDEAVAELRRCSGTQFDPACVSAFERALTQQSFPRPDWTVQRPTALQIVA